MAAVDRNSLTCDKPAFSSTKNATALAISSGYPSLFLGILLTILTSTSSGTAPTISVAIYPGAIQLMVIFLEAVSRARA